MQNAHQILKQYWGFSSFRPLQEEIIDSVLEGNDTLALLPTGGGKSLCFQLPALMKDGLCLVISPLIALMRDQVLQLNKQGIKAEAVHSGLAYKQIDTLLDSCVYGETKFLYISPERMLTEEFQMRFEKMNVSLLAVDEAHCISQWGYDFRPSYLRIAELRPKLNNVPLIALTATATEQVVADIQQKLLFKQKNVFKQSFARPNLSYVLRQTSNKNKALLDILNKVPGNAIVYVRNRRKTKEYADLLNKHHIKAEFYHAGLDPNQRSLSQDNWMHGKTRVICATNAFGMGINKPDVRLVAHLDLADSLEAYFQEAGRAGRDEKKAYAVQLIDQSDLLELEKKITETYPSTDFVKEVYESLCQYFRVANHSGSGQSFDFDLRTFSAQFQFNYLKALQALKILEQQELISLSEGLYSQSQIRAITGQEGMHRFQSENKRFEPIIKFILRTSEGVFENYVAIEEEVMASRLKMEVPQIIELLEHLHKFHIFSYQPRKEKPQIILLKNRVTKGNLNLDRNFLEQRKKAYEQKLKGVQQYATETSVCRTRMLTKYFGEILTEDCGVCDICLEKKKKSSNVDVPDTMRRIENELRQAPQSLEQLKAKLHLENSALNHAISFLMDSGKIKRAPLATLQWVD